MRHEDALRNLASRLTGQPVAKLPRTQEGVVQFMAENVPSLDELAESITMEVFARLVKTEAENPGSVVQQEDLWPTAGPNAGLKPRPRNKKGR